MDLTEQLKRQEGFRGTPYQDTEGVWTFGHGFTFLTVDESEVVLKMKVDKLYRRLDTLTRNLSPARRDVLVNMAFNLGFDGLMKFKKMWYAIHCDDFDTAADEMLDSKWHKQVKGRAVLLADQMRKG